MLDIWKCLKETPIGCLFFVCMALPLVATAQSVEELDRLDFGVLAIPSNSVISEVDLPRSGRNISVSGPIVLVSAGLPGRYLLSELPPNTPIDISANDTALIYAGVGGTEQLQVSQYDAPEVITNNLGEVEVQLGATLSTSGNGNVYEDGPYSGTTQLLLTYWDSNIGEYVTRGLVIDIETDVRTSFNLEEVEPFSFGTLFARATPDDQAEFRLAPDGEFSLINRGDARFVSLSEPQSGVLAVSGAAPDRQLTIELPTSNIQLRNSDEPTAPYFILSDFVSSPSGAGRTDEDGILEIFLGGTLSTQLTTEEVVYPAGTYEATYDITVSY